MDPDSTLSLVFPLVWAGLGAATFIFHLKASLATKRRWHPFISVGLGLVFLGFIALTARAALIIAGPAVLAITVLSIKMMRFCPSCSATAFQQRSWSAPTVCTKCGSDLVK